MYPLHSWVGILGPQLAMLLGSSESFQIQSSASGHMLLKVGYSPVLSPNPFRSDKPFLPHAPAATNFSEPSPLCPLETEAS